MNRIDLQLQSTASDGKHSPEELVLMSKEAGLDVIAVTDHDTVDGVSAAMIVGDREGVRVIPGIEFSAEDHEMHLLGYGFDHANAALATELARAREGRMRGARQMVDNLNAAGFIVAWEDVLAEKTGDTIARPHIARAVLKRPENSSILGGVSSVHDFINKFLANDSLNYVHRARISAADAIALIHGAGGVAVWSHPIIPDFSENGYDELEKFLADLIHWGIDGLEVFNPSHTEDDVEFLEMLAKRYGLLRTAGSDFHEKREWTANTKGLHSARVPGDYETHRFSTDEIISQLDDAIAKRRAISTLAVST